VSFDQAMAIERAAQVRVATASGFQVEMRAVAHRRQNKSFG
jgi:hypothetical protein